MLELSVCLSYLVYNMLDIFLLCWCWVVARLRYYILLEQRKISIHLYT